MTPAHEDLMVGQDAVKKCKERLLECNFWPYMDNDLKKHMSECRNCQVSKEAKFEKLSNFSHYLSAHGFVWSMQNI